MRFKYFIINFSRGLDLKLYSVPILRIVCMVICVITTDIVKIVPCVEGESQPYVRPSQQPCKSLMTSNSLSWVLG